MKKSKIVLCVVTALLVLSFMAGPVSAQDEPPVWDGTLPDLNEYSPRYDEDYPPEPITVNAGVDPVSPNMELVYSKWTKLYFSRDYYATNYRVEILDLAKSVTYTVKGTGTCDNYYCYLQSPVKLSTYNYPLTGGVYQWRVQSKVSGSWQSWSSYAPFLVMSKGFTSTFDTDKANWYDVYGTWTLAKGSLKTQGTAANLWDSTLQREHFLQFDYTVTMKRKSTDNHASCAIVLGYPTPLGSDKHWDDGIYFCYGNNKMVGVFQYYNGSISWISPGYWPVSVVKPYDWNTLRILVNGRYVDFWFNGLYLGYDDTALGIGMVGVTMFDSWDAKDPLLVDQVVVVADQRIMSDPHDPAMRLIPIPMDPDFNPGIIPYEADATGTR